MTNARFGGLAAEPERDMALMGIRTLDELGPHSVNVPAAWATRPAGAAAADPEPASSTLAP